MERGQLCPPETGSATHPQADLAVRAPNATISHQWSADSFVRRKREVLPTASGLGSPRSGPPTACGLGSPRSCRNHLTPMERGQPCPPKTESATNRVRTWQSALRATNCGRTWRSALPTQPSHTNGARAATPAGNGKRHAPASGLGGPRSGPRSHRDHLVRMERGQPCPPFFRNITSLVCFTIP